MRRLRDSIAVNCPIDEAQARIAIFFADRSDAGGKMRLTLTDREICVDARAGRDAQNLTDLIRVSWRAQIDVSLPAFAGTLVTWGLDDPKRTFIELDGTYVGEISERAVAQRTAKHLLVRIAEAIADAPGSQGTQRLVKKI